MQELNEVIIKKYANRRLYNTTTSNYITLDDLANMVKNNEAFKVIDVKTNQDITRITLAQIILEKELMGYELLPIEMIKTIIKFYDNPMNEVLRQHFNMALEAFNKLGAHNDVLNKLTENWQELAQKNLQYFNDFFSNNKDKEK